MLNEGCSEIIEAVSDPLGVHASIPGSASLVLYHESAWIVRGALKSKFPEVLSHGPCDDSSMQM